MALCNHWIGLGEKISNRKPHWNHISIGIKRRFPVEIVEVVAFVAPANPRPEMTREAPLASQSALEVLWEVAIKWLVAPLKLTFITDIYCQILL